MNQVMTRKAMNALVKELNRVDISALADQIGLSYGCLYAIREEKTKWPRASTLNILLPAVGLQVVFQQVKKGRKSK